MSLHFKWCVELFVAVFTLAEVTEVNVLLFAAVDVTLDVHHRLDVVIQHLGAVPALQQHNIYITVQHLRAVRALQQHNRYITVHVYGLLGLNFKHFFLLLLGELCCLFGYCLANFIIF